MVSFGILFVLVNLITILIITFMFIKYRTTKIRSFNLVGKVILVSYLVFLLSFLIVEGLIIHEIQTSKKDNYKDIDFVIILGAGLKGDQPSKTLKGRLEAGVDFLLKNTDLPVIVSGGKGPDEAITEAEAMANYLVENEISADRIYYESNSTTTYENIKFSKEIIEEELGVNNPTVLIVTSDFHLLRATMIGKEFGLHTYGLGGETPFFVKINYLIREYFGIVKTLMT